MSYSLSPLLKPRFFVNATNKPLVGGKLYTYLAETTTPATTYSNDTGTPNTNPIILDANGECNLYLDDDVSYRLILKDANDVTYFDKDRVSSIGGGDYKVLTFNTIDDLRLKIGSAKEPSAQTSGYYAAGDGGGNRFYWDGTSSAVDNGGTVIKPTFVSGAGRWLAVDTSYINVKQFGAVGDGVADDTAAIQAALDSLPINTASVGILTPKGYANGGRLHIPRGRYKVTAALNLRRGARICGESRESSQIISFTSDSVFLYEDAGGYLQDEIVIENLSIWQDASVAAVSGAAINLTVGPYSGDSIQVSARNVLVEGTYDGIQIAAGVACAIDGSNISRCVRHGIHLDTLGTSNTSVTIRNSYCHLNGGDGLHVLGSSYISTIGLASDSNAGYGYYFYGANGFSILGSGAEQNTSGAAYFKNTISGIVQLHMVVQDGLIHGITLDNANATTLLGCDFLSGALTTGYAVNFITPKPVTVIGPSYTGGFIANKFSSPDFALTLCGGGFFKGGDSDIWTFGATIAKDTSSQLASIGNAVDTVSIGLKSGVTFTAAGAIRNTAIQAQAITANTAVTYPLVIGCFIPNAAKGGASTITRLAGQYIAQQTVGSTANANIMIDAGAGTVPAGTWSIYNESTRENLFKGPIRWSSSSGPLDTFGTGTPEGVVAATVGSTYRRMDGGAGTSFYVKESGTGNTGWVAK